jgi:uncharacterized damage-inducible protein DinB
MIRKYEGEPRLSIIVKDYEYMQHILTKFCEAALTAKPSNKWHNHVRSKERKEWTFHQTLAHVTAAAEIYLQALEAVFDETTFVYPGMQKRIDLATLNDREIAARQHLPAQELTQNFLKALERTAQLTQSLTPNILTRRVNIPIFNRPLMVTELLDMQLIHPGILHAAQLTNAIHMKPLWTHYTPEFMHRQITRFFQLMALIYWPERGGNLQTCINFVVSGPGGGHWSITIHPSDTGYSEQNVHHAALTIWIRNTHALCQFFTHQESTLSALCKGKLLLWGDLALSLKLAWLFSPT